MKDEIKKNWIQTQCWTIKLGKKRNENERTKKEGNEKKMRGTQVS